MKNIEVNKIIDPIPASDGAGVKLKRSIGVEPNYFDPFLMLDEFGSENKEDYIAGFPAHPHRGIETVTYMLAGDFEHKDSTGGEGRMTAGDVQWMKTGSGIIHSEMPAMKEGKLHGFQLWINMPAKLKMNKPDYIYIDSDKMQIHKDEEKKVKVISGKFENAEGPIKGHNIEPVYFDEDKSIRQISINTIRNGSNKDFRLALGITRLTLDKLNKLSSELKEEKGKTLDLKIKIDANDSKINELSTELESTSKNLKSREDQIKNLDAKWNFGPNKKSFIKWYFSNSCR